MKRTNISKFCKIFLFLFFIIQTSSVLAIDLIVMSGVYDQEEYPGYEVEGTYMVELSKDNYSFTHTQFEINISLPAQGAYDPKRASEAVIPAGWELVVNTNTSLILRLLPGSTYSGTGAASNRRRNFYIPIITSAGVQDNPSLVTVEWKDFEVDENPAGNSVGGALNVKDVNLPVTLTHFAVAVEGSTNQLNWSTTQETNSDRFDVERSANGMNWYKIGTVKSQGESNVLRDYKLTDEVPLSGLNYYRLKMIDKDATYDYSRIVSAEFKGDPASVYPNPSSGSFRISEQLSVNSLELSNLSGQVIPAHLYTVKEDNQVEAQSLPSGLYLLKVKETNGTVTVHKLMISK